MLNQLVNSYFELDQQMKGLDKEKKPLNTKIKKEMKNGKVDKVTTENGVTATLSQQERVKLNEDKLLNKLQQLGLNQAIKTVERPDQDVVETLIYNGELDPSILEDCLEKKFVDVLTVKGEK